jgi:hypothetical protein
MVGNQFTGREATVFAGIRNRYFGGTKSQSDYYRSQGALWYDNITGTQHPEGFLNTAASAAESDVKLAGAIDINVNLKYPNDVVETTRRQATIGNQIQQVPVGANPGRAFIGG